MGYMLYREVKQGAPPEWNTTMRLVALAIADEANEKTRRTIGFQIEGYWPRHKRAWRDGLCEVTGLKPDSVTKALRALAEAGYEMRVSIGTDKNGRPVYAAKGHATDYQVPKITRRQPPQRMDDSPGFEPQRVDESPAKGGRESTPSPQPSTSEELPPQERPRTPSASEAHNRGADFNEIQDDQDQRRLTEQIITAYLSNRLGFLHDDGDHKLVAWMQRTITDPEHHKDAGAYARYQLRVLLAAREPLTELAGLVGDGHLDGEAGPYLAEMRRLAGDHKLTEDQSRQCDRVAKWAASEAREYLELPADVWPGGVTARQATGFGMRRAEADREHARERDQPGRAGEGCGPLRASR